MLRRHPRASSVEACCRCVGSLAVVIFLRSWGFKSLPTSSRRAGSRRLRKEDCPRQGWQPMQSATAFPENEVGGSQIKEFFSMHAWIRCKELPEHSCFHLERERSKCVGIAARFSHVPAVSLHQAEPDSLDSKIGLHHIHIIETLIPRGCARVLQLQRTAAWHTLQPPHTFQKTTQPSNWTEG